MAESPHMNLNRAIIMLATDKHQNIELDLIEFSYNTFMDIE